MQRFATSLPIVLPLFLVAALHPLGSIARGPRPPCPPPNHVTPAVVAQLHVGMAQAEVEGLLGPPTYSPGEGQYYFAIGGDCWNDSIQRCNPCGVVATYTITRYGAKNIITVQTPYLQEFWFGPIGE